MKKINWKSETDKKSSSSIEYIFVILLITVLILTSNIIMVLNNTNDVVSIETAQLNTVNVSEKETISNYKVQVLNYGDLSYYIKVNCTAQTVTIYTCDENGKYNIPIKAMLCSTGTATPNSGVFATSNKYEWRYLVGNVYGQYATRITGQILFHSVPYLKQDKSSLEYWEYDKLGQPVSKGCVRLTVEDAKWIYDYCKTGTQVEFYNDENPGPLGKPEEIKISEYSDELKNWDPTDPDLNNPWIKLENFNTSKKDKSN